MFEARDIVAVEFPGVTGVKRRPAVVLSSAAYHAARPDVIVGLVTSQSVALGPTDHQIQDWADAGLNVPSVFRSFLVTLPPASRPVRIGRLSDTDWTAVRACLKTALAALSDAA